MPHSELLGRPTTPGEARWTDKDRKLALALLAHEAATHSCGQPAAESFDPANEDAYTARAVRCHACAAAARAAKTHDKDTGGLYMSVEKT